MYISSALAVAAAFAACVCAQFPPGASGSPDSAPDQGVASAGAPAGFASPAGAPATLASPAGAPTALASPAGAPAALDSPAAGYADIRGIYYPQTPETYDTKFASLPVDHFANEPKTGSFMMPYIEISESLRSGGPIYILICENFKVEKELLRNGLLPELARETSGTLFAIGQRYSDSLPVPTNVKYLSTKQILHDIARFITIIKDKKELIRSKVVVVGTGATGKLAYWMKTNFNNLVDAVITDSNRNVNLEDPSKMKQIAEFFRKIGGETCIKQIRNKLERQQTQLRENGADEVRKQELLCSGTDLTEKNQWYAYNAIVYSQLLKALSLEQYQANQLCNKYVQATVDEDFCFILPNSTHWRTRSNYLQCSEYGMFATSSVTGEIPLDIPLQWYIDTCRENYGEKFNEEYIRGAVKKTNDEYERANVTRVAFLSEGVTLKSSNGMNPPGSWSQNWEEHDNVDRLKASIKKWINYSDRRSIDKYFFMFPSQPNLSPFA